MGKEYYKKNKYKSRNNFSGRNRRSRGRGRATSFTEKDLENAINSKKGVQETEKKHVVQNSFSDFSFGNILKGNISKAGFTKPTAIQDLAIPQILIGKDLIGIANTGTGKTAAFLLPLISKVFNDRTQKVLVVTPTRELAAQIEDEFRKFSRGMGIYSALLIGGRSTFSQSKALQRHPNFVIATPGRLKDLEQRNLINLNQFNNVVLDEADRMVDIGFINEIRYFLTKLPVERQSIFISATISEKVKSILAAFIDPENSVTVKGATHSTTNNITQEIVKIGKNERKIEILHDLLIKNDVTKTIVFGNTKRTIDYITGELRSRGFSADCIHGDKRQSQRKRVLSTFKEDRINVLLATNVAARGLDIDDVSHVINYDAPESYEEYVHRIGRTARAGKNGTAITFING